MKLKKGYRIINDRGRAGTITGFDHKNGKRVVEFEGDSSGWCYREQITEVYKTSGERLY